MKINCLQNPCGERCGLSNASCAVLGIDEQKRQKLAQIIERVMETSTSGIDPLSLYREVTDQIGVPDSEKIVLSAIEAQIGTDTIMDIRQGYCTNPPI